MRIRPPVNMKLLKEMAEDLIRHLEDALKERKGAGKMQVKDSNKGEKPHGRSRNAPL